MYYKAKKIRDLNPFQNKRVEVNNKLYNEYVAILMNNIKIIPTGDLELGYVQEQFIKHLLINNGYVGYDRFTNTWAVCSVYGLNDYWNFTDIQFIFPTARTNYHRKLSYEPSAVGAYVIKGFPTFLSFGEIIEYDTNIITEADISIMQNLKAARQPQIIVVNDENQLLSVQHAIEQNEEGRHAIVVNDTVGAALQSVGNETPLIVNEIETYREAVRDRLMNKIGTLTANINKRERVQVGEVNATVGQCEDYIALMIDTFNKQMETYGLPFKMEDNTSLEQYAPADSLDEGADDNEEEINTTYDT